MKKLIISAITALTFAAAAPGEAAVDYFLEIDGIPGEASEASHAGHIRIDGFAAKAFQKALVNAAGGQGGPALAIVKPVTVLKSLDSTSPKLFVACMTGLHIKKATIYADYSNEPGGGPQGSFLKIVLQDVQIASVDHGSITDGTRAVDETVAFSFAKIEMRYRKVLPNGTLGPEVVAGFDVKANKSLNF